MGIIKKARKRYKEMSNRPPIRAFKRGFKDELKSIQRSGVQGYKKKYKKTRLDKSLLRIKYGIDTGLGYK